MTMKDDDVAYRRRLLERWGHVCIVCGREFLNLASVTKEHVVPKSAPNRHKLDENLAPSHWRCNQIRKTESLIATARVVDNLEKTMPRHHFLAWLNKAVPHRTVPPAALMPLRVPQCFELPDQLPGMR